MKLNRIFLVLTTVGALLVGKDSVVMGASQAANLPVNVAVAANCTITTVGVTFTADYDPVVNHASSPDDGTGTITVTCTKGAGTNIGLNYGANASGTQPRMKGPGGSGSEYLNYTLYSDSGRSTVWNGTTYTIGGAPSKAPRSYTVYARIPGGQDISQGAYGDTVVATVNF
jgi:spore coat protein U-like protein